MEGEKYGIVPKSPYFPSKKGATASSTAPIKKDAAATSTTKSTSSLKSGKEKYVIFDTGVKETHIID